VGRLLPEQLSYVLGWVDAVRRAGLAWRPLLLRAAGR